MKATELKCWRIFFPLFLYMASEKQDSGSPGPFNSMNHSPKKVIRHVEFGEQIQLAFEVALLSPVQLSFNFC